MAMSFKILIIAVALGTFGSCLRYPTHPNDVLSFKVLREGNGIISISPSDSILPKGTPITITAKADSGNIFIGFAGTYASTNAVLKFSLTQNTSITAQFRQISPDSALVAIPARNKTFTMGSSSKQTQEFETPQHRVTFTYDFFMDRCEITQKLYKTLMHGNPSTPSTETEAALATPISRVSWYDAVLFCNARSKSQGYDTVYTYTSICDKTIACPFFLENLSIHYTRFGYRLPTEAEWEFACRGGTTGDAYWSDASSLPDDYAWYFENSSSIANAGGQKKSNAYGLFDMCGNVAEWVADTLDNYTSSPRINPVSRISEGYSSPHRMPIKGGSFKQGTSYLRSAVRKGSYDTPAYSTMDDIGFRTVLGSFTPDTSHTPTKPPADTLGIKMVADNNSIAAFIGTSTIKIALIKKTSTTQTLHYIDFGSTGKTIQTLPDSCLVSHPAISPDGNTIAYSSQNRGNFRASTITIRPITQPSTATFITAPGENAQMPHFWVSPLSQDTSIIYTDGISSNNQGTWANEKTYKRAFSGGILTNALEILYTKGSYYAGLSKDGRFLGTSGPIAKLIDRQIGDTNIFYFLNPQNGQDTSTFEFEASITPSSTITDELMFLDTGYSKTSRLVGRPYKAGEIIFICNSKFWTTEHVSHFFVVPSGYCAWINPQWSNHPDFAIACSKSTRNDTHSLFIINLKDSTYLEIARGVGIQEPTLWIDPQKLPEFIDPYAQFAEYNIPVQTPSQVTYDQKLHLLWSRRTHITGAIFGSSPTWYGVNPQHIKNLNAINMSAFGSAPGNSVKLAQNYAFTQMPNLKTIIMQLDPGWMSFGFSGKPQINGIEDSKGYEFDKSNNFYKTGIPNAIQTKINSFEPSSWKEYDSSGFTINTIPSYGWGEAVVDKGDFSLSDTTVSTILRAIEALADTARMHSVHLLLIHFPENPRYAETHSIGRYGPSRSTYSQIVSWVHSIELSNPFVHFYDANNYGNHDFTDADALDANHLGSVGAVKISMRIDSIVGEFLK